MRTILILCLLVFSLEIMAKHRNYLSNWRIKKCVGKYEKLDYSKLLKFRNDHRKIITHLLEQYGINDVEKTNDIIYCLLGIKYQIPKTTNTTKKIN